MSSRVNADTAAPLSSGGAHSNAAAANAAAAAAATAAAAGRGVKPICALAESDEDGCHGDEELRRRVNWTVGVMPQDVRFPVNIAEVAFTANYFAALTADKVKIFVNRRVPEEKANCKKKTIEFDADARPRSIVSYDCGDNLCVVFRSKIEFHSLVTLDKVGVYQTSLGEQVTTVASLGLRAPLGALWCLQDPKKPNCLDRQSTFTFWHDQVMVPQQLQFLGLLPKSDKFVGFSWTSQTTILLTSEPADAAKPVQFCSFDISGRRVIGRHQRRSVRSADQYRLSPNGKLLLLLCRSKYVMADAMTLSQLHIVPHQHQQQLHQLDHVVNNCGDLVLLNRQTMRIEFHRSFDRALHLRAGASFDLARCVRFQEAGCCHLHPVGNFGVLFVFKHDGREEGDQPKHYSSYSVVVLLDMQGHVMLRAEWPRGFVHLVTDELLVYLQYLSTKPFSAAHACIFNFTAPVPKKSFWALQQQQQQAAAASDGGDSARR